MGHLDKLIYKLIDTGKELRNFNSSLEKFIDENRYILQKIMSGGQVSALTFLELYDKRIYDIHSKQNDIKYMKELDFKGLYYIKNLTRKKHYIGYGDKVFRKVDRHFRGYGNQDIYNDFKRKDKFKVSFGKLKESGYDNLEDFARETKENINLKVEGYQYYDEVSENKPIIENSIKDKKLDDKSSIIAEKNNRELKKKRWKAFLFNKKKISLDVSTSEMIGKMYRNVIDILTQNGFINVEALPIKDIYVDSSYTPGEVEKVLIDGESMRKQSEMISYDAKIVVVYHLKKELFFPYSSRQVKKQNCEVLSKELLDIGFTEINMIAIKDLRKGWLAKDGSVETVIVGKQESYKRGLLLNYDTEINIFYHTFK